MVDINPNASGLQSQLQAQLQSGRGQRAAVNKLDLTPRPTDVIEERIRARQSEGNRQAPAQQSEKSNRSGNLSSAQELEAAQSRVSDIGTGQREAPIGRLSEQLSSQRDVPLGQIIDIRV
ncbi:hypothetical protein ACFO5Q_01080 [Kordiimonas lipolytica]|uniref:Uncharacterized protein n=1 Tax=Kordiimonas lipolytica TaxID=1662421 RepID=A0ABV8U6N7_9PROT|nr:hypothetical protein [Kordiimonas lipolytica]